MNEIYCNVIFYDFNFRHTNKRRIIYDILYIYITFVRFTPNSCRYCGLLSEFN